MGRIRSIKPEFPKDELLGSLARDVRFLYVLLWTLVDDEGRFRSAPALVKSELYPYDDDLPVAKVEEWLGILDRVGRVRLYSINGQRYGVVVRFTNHQRIDHPGKSRIPDPLDVPRESLVNIPESLARIPESLVAKPESLAPDLGSRIIGSRSTTLVRSEPDEGVWSDDVATPTVPPKPKPPKPRPTYPEAFEAWWVAYPRRDVGKHQAHALWARIIAKGEATADQLAACAKAYATVCARDGTEARFVKHATTFLSVGAKHWLDYIHGTPKAAGTDQPRIRIANP